MPRKGSGDTRKALFLAAYSEWGTLRKACSVTGTPRGTYLSWHSSDYKFAEAMEQSRREFAESLEGLALERVKNPDKGRGSDLLLIGLLNANWPAKYRPQVTMDQDSAREVLNEMKRWRKEGIVESGGVTDLSPPVEKQLNDILDKRGSAPKEKEEKEGG